MACSRQELIQQYVAISRQLRRFGIRRISDYAETLVAEALNGRRVSSGVNRGFDVEADGFGRIEVKYRQLPPDGRLEQRVELGRAKVDGFGYLAVVIFDVEMAVRGAVLIPYTSVWQLIEARPYRRISYCEAVGVSLAIDFTQQAKVASQS